MPKTMDPRLPILSILGYRAMIWGILEVQVGPKICMRHGFLTLILEQGINLNPLMVMLGDQQMVGPCFVGSLIFGVPTELLVSSNLDTYAAEVIVALVRLLLRY